LNGDEWVQKEEGKGSISIRQNIYDLLSSINLLLIGSLHELIRIIINSFIPIKIGIKKSRIYLKNSRMKKCTFLMILKNYEMQKRKGLILENQDVFQRKNGRL
jgi:hypothetical protein